MDLITGEVVVDSADNRNPVAIVAESTVLLLPCPIEVMNKHQLSDYVQAMLVVEYEMKWGKKKSKVKDYITLPVYTLIQYIYKFRLFMVLLIGRLRGG